MHESGDISALECAISGIKPTDLHAGKMLRSALVEWDYTAKKYAKKAYKEPCVERLQLLRQIKCTLKDGMGFSTLYDALEERRGKGARVKARAQGLNLQPWSAMVSSKVLRAFVAQEEHSAFIGGKVLSNKKWQFD